MSGQVTFKGVCREGVTCDGLAGYGCFTAHRSRIESSMLKIDQHGWLFAFCNLPGGSIQIVLSRPFGVMTPVNEAGERLWG